MAVVRKNQPKVSFSILKNVSNSNQLERKKQFVGFAANELDTIMTDIHTLQYGALPLSFIANTGQFDASVRFQARSPGGALSFTSDGVTLALPVVPPQGDQTDSTHRNSRRSKANPPKSATFVGIHLAFTGANPDVTLDGGHPLPGVANFFIGSDPSQWHTNVPTHESVVYHDLYPGIDLEYIGRAGTLKGTYTIMAGIDPAVIRWGYVGAESLRIDPSGGQLDISAANGVTLAEQAPVAWQMTDGMQMPVSVNYQLSADGLVQFSFGSYDKELPLIIDPGLAYSTYLGGSGGDYGLGIAVDSTGNAYITGYTTSTNFPTTVGAFQTTFGGVQNVFVSKLNAAGSALVYSTYLGGNGYDYGQGITLDSTGNAYIVGYTTSTNFPTTVGAFQTTIGSVQNAFVSKLNAAGSALVYSTYLGGSGTDVGQGITVSSTGNAYVTGYTTSTNFPTTIGAYQRVLGGLNAYNTFVSQLNAAGSALVYSTYVGGNGADFGQRIALDSAGNTYITGNTVSTNFPTTIGAFQTTISGGYDAFVSKLNATGSALIYSTYLGGSGSDEGYGIAVDSSGNAYITGYTASTNFPTTIGAYQTTFGGGNYDTFVSKLNAAGSALIYSTYLGGSGDDVGHGIVVDSSGNAYITGYTASTNFPTTIGAYQAAIGDSSNTFVSKLNAAGSALAYSTYLGGGYNNGNAIALDTSGNVYITGNTFSANFPTTYGGGWDVFVTKFSTASIEGPANSSNSWCPICYQNALISSLLVNIQYGEKMAQITDLSLNTPSGPLTFTRFFRQSKLNTFQQPLGLGWTHNHIASLTLTSGMLNVLAAQLPNGGEFTFKQSGSGSTHYIASPGSTSVVDYNAGSDQFTLTGMDKTVYLFENNGGSNYRLKTITWANTPNQLWNYVYDQPAGTVGKLTEVNDNYTNGSNHMRKLVFSYGTFNGQTMLQYVGDQTFNSSNLTGRYVAFNYAPNKVYSGGVIGNGIQNVFSSLRDVRGNLWPYAYYGQQATETDPNQLNFLTRELSPVVDPTGNNGSGAPITLSTLSYTMQGTKVAGITQQNGNGALSTAWAFKANGLNQTTETTAGKTTTYHFKGYTYAGSTDPAGNTNSQTVNDVYRSGVQTDARGNSTNLVWSTDGGQLNQFTDVLGHPTRFTYNSGGGSDGTLNTSIDTQGRTTQYLYADSNNPRLPTQVKVLDTNGKTVLRWQQFSYDTHGRTLTEQTLDPSSGTVEQQTSRSYYSDSLGTPSAGFLQSVMQQDLINPANNSTTTYFYDSAGRTVRTKQSATFGNCIASCSVFDAAGNVVASICNYDAGTNADPTTVAQAVALFNPAFPDKNHVTVYQYDALGRPVQTTTNANAPYAQTSLTVYDALNRVVRSIGNYVPNQAISDPYVHARNAFSHGPNNDQNLVTDTAYNERGAVKKQTDVLGNVTLYGYDDAGRLIKTVQYASQPTYDNSYDSNGDPTLSHYVVSSAPDQDLVTTSQYDAVGNLVKSTDMLGNVSLTGYDALNRPVRTIGNASQLNYNLTDDPTLSHYVVSGAADQDWLNYTEYDALGRVTRSQDTMGSWTLYGYNGLGQQVKVIRGASQPTYNLTADPTLSQYAASSAPDQDIISQTVYDSLGRVLYTSDVLGRKTWSAYDGLNRVVRTVTNASGSATDGSAYDPRSSSYSAVQMPDQDLISSTVYDLNGYVMYTVDPLGRKTWTGYDDRGRQIRTVVNALGSATDGGSNDPTSSRYIPNIATDVDVVSQTVYDAQGRVAATIDPQGNRTQFTYDSLGRRTQTIVNFVMGVPNAAVPDQDLISRSVYDIAGRVTTGIDPRGMNTTSTYDRAGRRLTTTQAADSGQAITSYTCYDKGGRVLRTIQNWVNDPRQPSPDARDANGNWVFNNPLQGNNHDRNLITGYSLDRAGRQVAVIDSIGNQTQMTYAKDGQLISMTDPLGAISTYRYDLLRRRTLTVQNYVTTNRLGIALADPQTWTWNKTSQIWQDGKKTFIHDGNAADPTDQNLISQVTYDKAGRTLTQRDPKGQATSYSYNLLNQRTQLIDSSPTPQTWKTDYRLVGNGTTQTKLTDPVGNVVQQTTDRLGRLSLLQYPAESAPKPTPDITFSYDRLGNRVAMSENNGVVTVRRTTYAYDRVRRLSTVVLDVHGDGSLLQQVGYQYDPGGLRQQLTLPDGKTVSYQYNTRRQLTNMIDWAGQSTRYGYDGLGRLGAAFRPNGLLSQYSYDAASRLLTLRHSANGHTLASFNYTVDARGNRTQVLESMAGAGTPGTTTLAANDSSINYYRGNWTVNGSLMTSVDSSAALRVPFFGTQATLTMGTGFDHSVFDIYLDGDLWQSGDGYAATTGTQTFSLTLNTDGPHTLEVRNRPERNLGNTTQPAVYRLDMAGLSFIGQPAVVRTTVYAYDSVSRLRTADSFAGLNSSGTALQHYAYSYDLAGNRTQAVAPAGTTNFTYDSANHLLTSQLGAGPVVNYTYDHAGRLTNDGANTYTWDGANRLLSVGSTSYLYNGTGQRMQQTVSSTVTQYVLDTQPGLAKVLQSTTGSNITRYVHGPMGIQEQQNPDATWRHPIQDGLGSVRTVVDTSNTPQESRWYDPYGTEIQQSGSQQTVFGFTGEETDSNGLVNLRARYYNPTIGQFLSLDPLETANRFAYVNSNPINRRDPTGLASIACDLAARLHTTSSSSNAASAFLNDLCDVEEWCAANPAQCQNYINNELLPSLKDIIGSEESIPDAADESTGVALESIYLLLSIGGQAAFEQIEALLQPLADRLKPPPTQIQKAIQLSQGQPAPIAQPYQSPSPSKYDTCQRNDQDDCDANIPAPFAAAVYARIARKEYYEPISRRIDFGKPNAAPITVAVSKVKTSMGRCVEIAATSNVIAGNSKPDRMNNFYSSQAYFANTAMARGAVISASTIFTIGQPSGGSVQPGNPVKGHAENNLYNLALELGANLRAIGISQEPCGNPSNPGCGLWFKNTLSGVSVAYYNQDGLGPIPF
jgi:RHS repeat-associated protein